MRRLPWPPARLHHVTLLQVPHRDRIAITLGVSVNSVKTHLQRGGRARPIAERLVNESGLERRLIAAFADARTATEEARICSPGSTAASKMLGAAPVPAAPRRLILTFVAASAVLALALSDFDNRRFIMPWWVIRLITNIVLIALAIGLGPFIKRFGRSYAADVFRANPRTGKKATWCSPTSPTT
ncbi:MAG: hypothetical protein IPL07_21930 [Acidimicrobiaceae bacterium]|nr:hypothetical protein [Acidimicrobiaceae bacterium]